MKKTSILYFILLTIFFWTACGGDDSVVTQLQADQTTLTEQATQLQTAMARFKNESAELKQLAGSAAENPEIAALLKQYDDMSGSLENMHQWYTTSSSTYQEVITTAQSGNLTENALNVQTKAIKEKMMDMDKRANMTIEELDRMRNEIETAIKKATPAPTTEEG